MSPVPDRYSPGDWVASTGQRNSVASASDGFIQPSVCCRPSVELAGDHRSRWAWPVDRQIGALGKVLAEQAVGVLVAAPLPGAVGVAEVDRQAGLDGEPDVFGHLLATVPGQAPAKLGWQGQDLRSQALRGRPRPSDRGAVRRAAGSGSGARRGCRWRSGRTWPMMRSPSQCPGTARSSTSAGRSLMSTMSASWPAAVTRLAGRRRVRPLRR